MVNRSASVLLTAVLAGACDSERSVPPVPSVPSAPSTPPSPAPTSRTVHVVGSVVDGGGMPVPGADMKFHAFSSPSPLLAVTDASGAYDVTFDLRSTAVGTEVMVEKPGYEPSWHWTGLSPLDAGKDLSRNFRLHQNPKRPGRRIRAPVHRPGRSAMRFRFRVGVPEGPSQVAGARHLDCRSCCGRFRFPFRSRDGPCSVSVSIDAPAFRPG